MNKSYKVLVVEDEGLIALDISNRLEALGHQVVATVGDSAEALLKAPEADIVLMDIRIDGPVDGIETAAQIREKFHIPVIFLTANSLLGDKVRGLEMGGSDYVTKPFKPEELRARVRASLRIRSKSPAVSRHSLS